MENMESQLIEKAKNGDSAAFEKLIQLYEKKVYNIALRMSRNHDDALDISQDVFIRVYRSLSGFKEESSFSTWLFRITTNICIDHLRKRERSQKTVSLYRTDEDGEEFELPIVDPEASPELHYDRREMTETLRSCVDELPPDQREIIVLRDINGLSYEEIAQVLDCNLGTVKSRINRARNRLQMNLLKAGNFFSGRKSNTLGKEVQTK